VTKWLVTVFPTPAGWIPIHDILSDSNGQDVFFRDAFKQNSGIGERTCIKDDLCMRAGRLLARCLDRTSLTSISSLKFEAGGG
jgi:hypothetical protein